MAVLFHYLRSRSIHAPSLWLVLFVLMIVVSCGQEGQMSDLETQQSVFRNIDFITLRDHLDSIAAVEKLDSNSVLISGMQAFKRGRQLIIDDDAYGGSSLLYDALKKFKDIGYTSGEGYAYFLLAVGFQQQYQTDSAIIHYEQARLRFKESGDTTGLLSVYNNLGGYFTRKNNFIMAEQNYAEAERLLTFPTKIGVILKYNIASFRLESEDSLSYHKVKTSLLQLLNYGTLIDSTLHSNIYNSLSATELLLENPDSAIIYAFKSIAYLSDSNSVDLQYPYLNLADCYSMTSRRSDFDRIMDKIRGIYDQMGPEGQKQYHYKMLETKVGRKNKDLEEYIRLTTQIQNDGFSDKLVEIKSSFAVKEKQTQIDILAKGNELQETQIKLAIFVAGLSIVFGMVVLAFLLLMIRQRRRLQRSQKAIECEQQKTEEANQALAGALRLKDRLLSIIAHDLRGPFGGQKELIELYSEMPDLTKDDIRHFFAIVKDSSSSLYQLLENLLLWANNQGVNPNFFLPIEQNVVELIDETIVPLRSWANLKNIKITVQAAPQINARVDENMFKTIVRNLISNAIKYSEPGNDICVTLTPNDDEIVITVADQGRGINAELLSSLFQNKEEVLDRSLAENKIGLGLVLCSDFTIRHNGRIWAESEIGKGTKISFTIPLRVNIEC